MSDPDTDDLQQFVQHGTHLAFTRLVERHLDLVYSVALRHVRVPHLAEDVAQSVFLELARNGRSIKPGTPLVAWLHVVARRIALNAARAETRRQAREAAASVLAETIVMPPPSSDWRAIEPLLDEAVESLPPADRTAILLRFFENKSLRDVGAALGTSDDAAQKRVTRAVDHLRVFLLRRGVSISSTGLAAGISAHAVQLAPATLASSVASLASAAAFSATPLVVMTLTQKIAVGAAAVAIGAAAFQAVDLFRIRSTLSELSTHTAKLRGEVQQARSQKIAATERLAATRRSSAPEPPAANAGDATLQAEITAWFARVANLRRHAAEHPELVIPEMKLLTADDWHEAADAADSNRDDPSKLLARLRATAKGRFVSQLQGALKAYVDAHEGELPPSLAALLPLFHEPIDPALLDRYALIQRGKVSDLPPRERWAVVVERPTDLEGAHYSFGTETILAGSISLRDHAARALRNFSSSQPGAPAPAAAALLPYFHPPLSPKLQETFLQSPQRYLSRPSSP